MAWVVSGAVDDVLLELTLDDLLERLAAPAPAPAGGSAAALVAAMAASLVEMIGHGSPAWSEGRSIAAQASALRSQLVALAAEDAREVARLLQQARQPPTPDHSEKLARALMDASEPPLAIAEAAADLVELAAQAQAEGKHVMRADAAVAATLANAAAVSALLVIEANLQPGSGDETNERNSKLLQRARAATARAAQAHRADRSPE